MKHNLSLFLVPLILLCAAEPALVAQGGAEPLSCADRSITASAVRTPENVKRSFNAPTSSSREWLC